MLKTELPSAGGLFVVMEIFLRDASVPSYHTSCFSAELRSVTTLTVLMAERSPCTVINGVVMEKYTI